MTVSSAFDESLHGRVISADLAHSHPSPDGISAKRHYSDAHLLSDASSRSVLAHPLAASEASLERRLGIELGIAGTQHLPNADSG